GRAPDAQDRGPARPPGRGADGEPVALQAGHMSAQGLPWSSAPRQGSGSGRTEHPVVGGCGGGNPPGGGARSAPPHAELMTWELIPADVERLAALVTERSGLAFPESRWPFLRNRAREVMVRSRFTSARRWLEEVELSAGSRGSLYCELEESLQVH